MSNLQGNIVVSIPEEDLGQKSALGMADYVRVVGSDGVSYKQGLDDVSDKIITEHNDTQLGGVEQSVKSAIDTLDNSVGALQTDNSQLRTRVDALQAAVGTPLVASTVSQMTDHDKIYVYVGSESGYTNGNWYYWNGSAWTSGGVYNSTAFATDKTLTLSDRAADAKVTGDEIDDLKSELNGKEKILGTAIAHVVIYPQGSDGVGSIGYYNNNNVIVFPLEDGRKYFINTTRLSSGYVALSNYLYEGTTVTYNKKLFADANGDINFINSDNHKYAYIYTKVESDSYDAVCYVETETFKEITELKASTSYTDMILPKLRGISGTFESQTVTPISGKYIFGEPNSVLNGSVLDSYAQVNYATFNVEEGDVFEISTCANTSVPFATFFNGSTPSASSYVSTVEFVSEAKEYIKRIVIIPQGVTLLGVNTININSYPIVVSKYSIDDYLHCFYELNINSFSKTPLDRMSNAISAFDKIICLGDSVVEGGENPPSITPDPANAKRTVTDAEYSFPTYLTKMYGVETVNCGHSGYSSVDLYNHYKNSDLSGYDGAIIEVGTNDSNISQDADTAIQESKTAMLALIAKLRADNPGIRIFLCTTLSGWASGTVGDGVRANIADIVSNTVGVYLVDFYNFTKCKADSAYRNNHPTAIGYRQLAQELSSACDYYMELYPNQFKWLRTIGTQYAVIDY